MSVVVERLYQARMYTNYVTVAGYALVVADYLHTLPDEVRLMWSAPLGVPKVLFFVVRYYVLIVNTVFSVYGSFPINQTAGQCLIEFKRAATILSFRVYAFSGRSRVMLAYLVVQFIAIHTAVFITLFKFIDSIKFMKWPYPNMHNCMPVKADTRYLGGVFTGLLGSVVIIMVIMIYMAFRKHRGLNLSPLLATFYRDGVFYFVCLSILASVNISINFAIPPGYQFLFTQLEVELHAILSTRMLLHLREIASRSRELRSDASDSLPTPGKMNPFSSDPLRRFIGKPPSTMRFQEVELKSARTWTNSNTTGTTVSGV
ncbi:hypothetical protein DFP72DRAFT_1138541 [Ephemerocybe angulata]|uniref:DUF6533 domain-containing protein n=1 Tax=Ephemerocybe angulata TaxID=980116 RepID=A0A8H6HPW7_9AGAR|nr:hypothetical protein DFP72DRAFT_1138541 [Tulosesus angulatus]